MTILRFPIAFLFAVLLIVTLFSFLHTMTNVRNSSDSTAVTLSKVEFVRLHREMEVEEKKREKPQRVKPEQAPVTPTMAVAQEKGIDLGLDVQAIAAGIGAEFGSAGGGGGDGRGIPGGLAFGGGMSDRGALPLVRVEPQYPPQAARRGLEGWVQLRFNISTAGSVKDAVVVKSSSSLFDRAAVQAVNKWKYQPQVQGGTPMETQGIEVVLRFELDK